MLETATEDTQKDFSAIEAFESHFESEHAHERLEDDNVADFLGGTVMQEPEEVQLEIHEAWVEDEKRLAIEEALGHPLYETPAFLLVLWTLNT